LRLAPSDLNTKKSQIMPPAIGNKKEKGERGGKKNTLKFNNLAHFGLKVHLAFSQNSEEGKERKKGRGGPAL